MAEKIETTKIGKWNVPKKLYDEYVKFRIFANSYVDDTADNPCRGTPAEKYERAMRWELCVKRVMELHREICASIGVEYSMRTDDEFCKALLLKTTEDTKLKG